MDFKDMEYKRPDIGKVTSSIRRFLERFEKAETAEEQIKIISEANEVRIDFTSMMVLAFINYSIETGNKEYQEEQNYFDDSYPEYSELIAEYYTALVSSKFRKELEDHFGDQLFVKAELLVQTISPEIVPDLKKENHLGSEYIKLIASAKITFEGEERNLQDLIPFLEDKDREVRKKASEAFWGFFSSNSEKLDHLYDELVKVRNGIASKLGYNNFVELGYKRMERSDYDSEDVENFRQQVRDHIVPIASKLYDMQKERLGLSEMKYYDFLIQFPDGNALPKGDPEWIVGKAKQMYEELSPETGRFFNFMIDNNLMDLYTRKGKADMGYCDYISKYKSPYIFANMNGTDGDITVLTHEAGHAYQAFESGHFEIKEYYETTSDAAEIHSMSMEFLTWPWMNFFFEEQTEKFKFSHLCSSILFIPYGVLVDEFQHYVYYNPDATPEERNKKWRELERIYLPKLDYDGNEFLENGGRWQKQGHIYEMPFYYIDYCLAQVCAFQFWVKAEENREQALEDYIRLCKAGGSKSFLGLVELAGLQSPFEEGCVSSIIKKVENWLYKVDTTAL